MINATPPTMDRKPITLTMSPTTSVACVRTSPTNSRDHPDQNRGAGRDHPAPPETHKGLAGSELRVVPVEGPLDLIEPALFVLR
jgi:hypothetical protein